MAVKISSSVVLVVSVLVFAMAVTAPLAEAQSNAILGAFGTLINQIIGPLIQITGTVFCSVNSTVPAPPFSYADVVVQCNGSTVAATTTYANGSYALLLDPLNAILTSFLLQNCRVVVATPLSTCNATLPSTGALASPLQFVGTTALEGLLTIVRFVSSAFQFVPN